MIATLHKSDLLSQEVVEGLKIEYYTPNYDPLIDHLLEISSWKEEYGDDNDILTEKFMSKIEETDTDKDVIIGILTTKVVASLFFIRCSLTLMASNRSMRTTTI